MAVNIQLGSLYINSAIQSIYSLETLFSWISRINEQTVLIVYSYSQFIVTLL